MFSSKIHVFLTFLYDQNLSLSGSVNLMVSFLEVENLSELVLLFHQFSWVVNEFSILNYIVSPLFGYFPFSGN